MKPNSIDIANVHSDEFDPLVRELFELKTPILLLDHKDNPTARIARNCKFLDARIVALEKCLPLNDNDLKLYSVLLG